MTKASVTGTAAMCAALSFGVAATASGPPSAPARTEFVKPSLADSRITSFDEPNVVVMPGRPGAAVPLVVFLPSTGDKPSDSMALLQVVASQGYRVIGLQYNNLPPGVRFCQKDADSDCFAAFREMRSTGGGTGAPVSNTVPESIVGRLVAMLRYLVRIYPGEEWSAYLDGDQPRWDRLVLSGLSQGAGMAAYLAKRHQVARVVLFSSPWDFVGPNREPARWLSAHSATPMSRWHAEYNSREATAGALKASYARLGIPARNIRVFSRDIPADATGSARANPYHYVTVTDIGYAGEWRAMFGSPSR